MPMRLSSLLVLSLVAATALSGCKLVKNETGEDAAAAAQGLATAGSDMDARVAEMWDAQVLPHFAEASTDLATLIPAIRTDIDAAGEQYGYRPASEGSPWNFATSLSGTIVAANTETRAATADVDIDNDGEADVTVQLGPVIRGTTLRDVLPFIDFTSFTDQIVFAQLSRSLNTVAFTEALEPLAREALIGRTIEATGAFTMRSAGEAILFTPVSATLGDAP
jgi:predicted lipoprotein